MTENLLTAEELADRVGVSARTIIEWARAGRIPEIRLSPRVRRFDYEDVLSSFRHAAVPVDGLHVKEAEGHSHESL